MVLRKVQIHPSYVVAAGLAMSALIDADAVEHGPMIEHHAGAQLLLGAVGVAAHQEFVGVRGVQVLHEFLFEEVFVYYRLAIWKSIE